MCGDIMKYLAVNPQLCVGCSSCSLICSITWQGEFNPNKAYIRVKKHDLSGLFEISFSSECKHCKKCGMECPAGALSVVEVEDEKGED